MLVEVRERLARRAEHVRDNVPFLVGQGKYLVLGEAVDRHRRRRPEGAYEGLATEEFAGVPGENAVKVVLARVQRLHGLDGLAHVRPAVVGAEGVVGAE